MEKWSFKIVLCFVVDVWACECVVSKSVCMWERKREKERDREREKEIERLDGAIECLGDATTIGNWFLWLL